MTTHIEYDLSLRESEMYDHEPMPRFAVIGQMLTGYGEECIVAVASELSDAFRALRAEYEREDGFDILRVVEISTGREIKQPRGRNLTIERGEYQGQSVLWARVA